MCVCVGGGHCSCNASLSQPNVQKNSRALVRGNGGVGGGGLIFWKKMLENNKVLTEEKNWVYVPLYFFIHPQPNNIGPARQQPRDWGSLLISLSLVGEGVGTAITY